MEKSDFKKEFVDRKSVNKWMIFLFFLFFIIIGCWVSVALYQGYTFYFSHVNSYELAKIIIATIYVIILLLITPYGLTSAVVDFFIIGFKFKKIASLPFKLYKNSIFDSLEKQPYVGIICPTCDDFMPEVFEKNLKQNYKNVIFYILDDSRSPEYTEKIDKFVLGKHNVKVIRRTVHNFAKTGNINNFLRTEKTPCEYYVFLDSDTIMRPDFVELNIKLFYSSISNLALVTSQISAHRTNSVFENIIHYRVGNTTPYFLLQNNIGMASYLGWAGIIKKSVLEEINFFPEEGVLNDDQGMQLRFVENNLQGFFSNLSPVTSQEPLTMFEFNKRESRWYNANADLLIHEKISKNVLKSKKASPFMKKAYFENSFLFTFIIPFFGILSLFLNTTLYVMHFQPDVWYSIKSSWIYI